MIVDFKTLPKFRSIVLENKVLDIKYTIEPFEKQPDPFFIWYKHTNSSGLYLEYALKKTIKIINEMVDKHGYVMVEFVKE